jgi:hypothetical protein
MPSARSGNVRCSASCLLELDGSTLTLEMWPKWMWRSADGGGRLVVRADEALIFPVRKKWRVHSGQGFGYMRQWIGVQPKGRRASYFYAKRRRDVEAILDALEVAGFKVSPDERPLEEY